MRRYYGIEFLRLLSSLTVTLYHYRHFFSPYSTYSSSDFDDSKINLPLSDINNLSENTNSLIRESRSTSGNLNYLSGDKRFKEIENCEVIDLSDDKNNLVKLKHLT